MKDQSVEIKLLGQKITLKFTGDSKDTEEVIRLVSQKLADAEKRGKSLASHQVALLALLDLAEENVQVRKHFTTQKRTMNTMTRELSDLIEAEFA